MTSREFYNAVIENRITEAEIEFAKAALVKIDNANERRRSSDCPRKKANEEIKSEIMELFTPELILTASEIADGVDITPHKASGLLKLLVDEGRLEHFKDKPHEPYVYRLKK